MGNYLEAFSNVLSEQAALSQNGTGPKDVIPQPVVPTDEERQQWMNEQEGELSYLSDHKIIAEFDSIALVANSKGLGAKVVVTELSREEQRPIGVKLEYAHKIIADRPTCREITLAVARGKDGVINGVQFTTNTNKSEIIPPDPEIIGELVANHIGKSFATPEPVRPRPSELVLTAPSLSL